METNDLKSIWKESGTSRKSESSLAPMTKIAATNKTSIFFMSGLPSLQS